MFTSLTPRAIGIRDVSLPQALDLAKAAGFAGLDFDIREAAALTETHDVDFVRGLFERAAILPGHWALPVAWRQDEQWADDLRRLPDLAALGRALGCTRTTTVMLPGSDERPYRENFAWHVERLRPIAEVLRDFDCRLGIEFIGPKTSRSGRTHEFIYTLGGLMELAGAIGTGNVGALLDAWHLYTSGDEVDALDHLGARDVVVVHVNDAPPGVPREAQIDNVRALPMETGVIDLPGFMGKLRAMGYDGPVTPEPFSQRLVELAGVDPLGGAREAARSMDALWKASGLS